MIKIEDLIKSGVHFGHQTWRWCPRMEPYIWGEKNGVHLIDVSMTARQLEKAAQFLEGIAAEGKCILWVGTKKAAQSKIQELAGKLNYPFVVHRWIGGTFTNFPQVKKSVTKLLHLEDVLSKTEEHLYTKKELGILQKTVERLQRNIGGISSLTWPVGAVVIVDVKKENTVVREAVAAGIPIVGLVDTNSDPSMIDYVVPANDDIPRSIAIVLEYLSEAAERGKAKAATTQKQEEAQENTVEAMIQQVLGEEEEAKRPSRRRGTRSRRPSGGQKRPATVASSKEGVSAKSAVVDEPTTKVETASPEKSE